jgi:hypothetical protein
MLKKSASIVLSRPSPCNVPQGYASVAGLPAALLNSLFEHPALNCPETFSQIKLSSSHTTDF